MTVRVMPETIKVEELIEFPDTIDETGSYSYYQIKKDTVSSDDVRHSMALSLHVTPSAIVFPALRKFSTETMQYASVRKAGPEVIQGEGYVAQLIRTGPRKLRMEDIRGNRFTVRLEHVPQSKITLLKDIIEKLQTYGLPNYYGKRRFSTETPAGFIGKAIIEHQAQHAVELYLAEPQFGDSDTLQEFKNLARTHWGQWGYLLDQAPQSSNFRSVMTFLKDNPTRFEEAVNLIRDEDLTAYLYAYQAFLWNQIMARYVGQYSSPITSVLIANKTYPLPAPEQTKALLADLDIELPRLTAAYPDEIREIVKSVLSDEDIALESFDLRLLRRVCLANRTRPAHMTPLDMQLSQPEAMDSEDASVSFTLSFDLETRQYASLVIHSISAYLEDTSPEG